MKTSDIENRILTTLEIDGKVERMHRFEEFRQNMPAEAFTALISMLDSQDNKIRRRAANALNWFRDQTASRVDVLVNHLQHDNDPEVRLQCAGQLMREKSPVVDFAYAHATGDADEKVALIACNEAGFRGGAEGVNALFNSLTNALPKVRLFACIALVRLGAADEKVVSTLEELRPLPEGAEHFRVDPEMSKLLNEMGAGEEQETFESLLVKATTPAKTKSTQ